ncbi:uncharacterized protein BT62DRAFT_913818, partial [Guyanagaster necrorhizus]
ELHNVILAATDSSCLKNRIAEVRAGTEIFVKGETNLELAIRVSLNLQQSNQVGKAVAIKVLAESIDIRVMLHDTNSKYISKHLTTSRQGTEDTRYISVSNKEIL